MVVETKPIDAVVQVRRRMCTFVGETNVSPTVPRNRANGLGTPDASRPNAQQDARWANQIAIGSETLQRKETLHLSHVTGRSSDLSRWSNVSVDDQKISQIVLESAVA